MSIAPDIDRFRATLAYDQDTGEFYSLRQLGCDNSPRCPRGQFEHFYKHPELGTLVCHLEGERGDPDSGQRDTATLYSAYLRGVDIADRLTRDEVEAIEIAAASKPIEQLEAPC